MKRIVVHGLLGLAALLGRAADESVQTIDLAPFVGKSQFDRNHGEWLLPRGRQIADGVPFQSDGIVELASRYAQSGFNGPSNVNGIRVEQRFAELHLLAAARFSYEAEGAATALLALHYADGSSTNLGIEFGRHIRAWLGPRHDDEPPLLDARTKVAWTGELRAAARRDSEVRLFHSVLTNPFPAKVVSTFSVTSTVKPGFEPAIFPAADPRRGPLQMRLKAAHLFQPAFQFFVHGKLVGPDGSPVAGAVIEPSGVIH